ncbi:DUF4382 domain-containing protein [Desulfoluna spongiiphila]|uniref:DUF4382 domain-containing protein n=1 Tax=Desulfoluna spongiiphila TaxID=419481 RepID=A0A1G5EI41_9BACT|nr:DUF4382 domain-containing protein [Desulfoluna spongiiphila]SCY26118.1 protein of unknown function [Desulfoluna spongiiphila]
MNPRFAFILAALAFVALTGCSSSSDSTSSSGFGDLTVNLTDAPSPDYKAVYISVNQVEVNRSATDENGWQVVDIVNETINLLDLTGGILKSLGTREMPAGEYNQVRLVLASAPDGENNILGTVHPFANYAVELDDSIHELKIPSEDSNGVTRAKQFIIDTNANVVLILDFDVMKSVVQGGDTGQWFLKSVIEVLDTREIAGITGSVTDSPTPGTAQQGTRVSVQTYDGFAIDPKDRVINHASTLTDAAGSYILRVPESTYNLVVYKDGFNSSCRRVTPLTGNTLIEDFALTSVTARGTLRVRVNGISQDEESVTVSVRRDTLCGTGTLIFVELISESYAADGDYDILLPLNTYTVVAYGDTLSRTLSDTREITSGGIKIFEINL